MPVKQVASSKCTIAQNLKKNRILREIATRNLVSRSELCRITGLSAAVMSRLTSELITEGLIREMGASPSREDELGRRSILLGLNKSARYVIGLDVGASELKAAVFNLSSEIIARINTPASMSDDPPKYIHHLAKCIRNLVAKTRLDFKEIESLVVAVPGGISPDEKNLVTACNVPGLQNAKLDKPLEEVLGIPVKLTNVMTAWAISEYEHAKTLGEPPDMILANVAYGIGITPVIGGKVFFGRQFSDSPKIDFGHINHSLNGPKCHCGMSGCIEAYASGWAIERDARKNPSSQLLELVHGDVNKIHAQEVFDAAKRGDSDSQTLIREAAMVYGQWLSVFIQYYRPSRVIFGGQMIADSQFYLDTMIKEILRHMPQEHVGKVTFQKSALDKFGPAQGAAKLRIHELLNEQIEGLVEVDW